VLSYDGCKHIILSTQRATGNAFFNEQEAWLTTLERQRKLERQLTFYNLRFLFILLPIIIVLILVIVLSLL